jgi:uncharacterized protein involved in response to NO
VFLGGGNRPLLLVGRYGDRSVILDRRVTSRRTARGHTGRLLKADRWDVACYVLVLASALVRVVVPLAFPQWTIEAIVASAGLWSTGFALYAVCYWKVLTRARLDGKPG